MVNLGVIYGGESAEHDISIITGLQLIMNCDTDKYNVIPIYIDKKGVWNTGKSLLDLDDYGNGNLKGLKKCLLSNNGELFICVRNKAKKYIKLDVVVLCMHGRRGEDGCLAGMLEMYNIPYASASICGSSVCMDKSIFKDLAKGLGVPVVEGFSIRENEFNYNRQDVLERITELGYPIIIKPSRQGSSIGIEVCEIESQVIEKMESAFKYDNKILIEKFVKIKKEVNIAVFNDKGQMIFSQTEEPITKNEFLNFEDKYVMGGFENIKRIIPAKISKEQYDCVVSNAKLLYDSLEMFGVVRIDFLIDDGDEVFVNEINTIPGSMANYLFDKNTLNYSALIDRLVSNAVYRINIQHKTTNKFDSGVLKSGIKGFKK